MVSFSKIMNSRVKAEGLTLCQREHLGRGGAGEHVERFEVDHSIQSDRKTGGKNVFTVAEPGSSSWQPQQEDKLTTHCWSS